MVKSRILKMSLDGYGRYLGRDEGCFIIRDRKNGTVERYPHYSMEIGEAVLMENNYVSVEALRDLILFKIDTYIVTQKNWVVGMLRSLEDDGHVATRLKQYEAYKGSKGINIAKQVVLSKIGNQNKVLSKYGLEMHDYDKIRDRIERLNLSNLESMRKVLISIEGRFSQLYFTAIFGLFPENLRPKKRVGYKAYEGVNNLFNFSYHILRCKIHKALIKAKLEPYLGFLHSIQYSKPSLVCDFLELYRYLIDDYLIERCQKYHKRDFVEAVDFKERLLKYRKWVHLCSYEAGELAKDLNAFFDRKVDVPRIKKFGYSQTLDTLICEEALLFAKFIRGERESWVPRGSSLSPLLSV
jgi:CRISPR-associated protein Cas1